LSEFGRPGHLYMQLTWRPPWPLALHVRSLQQCTLPNPCTHVNPGTYEACRGFALDPFGKPAILLTLAPPATRQAIMFSPCDMSHRL